MTRITKENPQIASISGTMENHSRRRVMRPGSAVATFDLRPLEALDALLCRNLYTPQQFLRRRDFDLPERVGPPQTGCTKAMSLQSRQKLVPAKTLGTDNTYHTWVGVGNRLDPNFSRRRPFQVGGELRLEPFDRLRIDPCGSLIGFDLQPGLPDQRLGNVLRFAGHERFLPVAQLISHARRMTPSLRSPAITAVSTLLRTAPSLGGASLMSASRFGLGPFAWHRRRRFPQFNARA